MNDDMKYYKNDFDNKNLSTYQDLILLDKI